MDRMTVYDRKGCPIKVGDVLKVFHFKGWCRRGGVRTYWIYKVVVKRNDGLSALSITDIGTEGVDAAHEWRLWASRDADGFLHEVEVVDSASHGGIDFTDRPFKPVRATEVPTDRT